MKKKLARSMTETHKCADCGYLTFRNYETRELVETEKDLRERGYIPPSHLKVPPLSGYPLCFANAARLTAEYSLVERGELEALEPDAEAYAAMWNFGNADGRHAGDEYILRWRVVHRERKCDAFISWIQGFTPKEHREMFDRQRLLESQTKRDDDWQKWQAEMATADKQWRENQETKAEKRHEQQLGEMRGIHKTEMLVMGGAVTGAILLITVVGAAIEAGWIPKWFGLFA